ncbi:MAG: phage tail protein [Faecalibacterium sp.]|nr:phage tail protein [Faecalibacterium sp.]
MISFPLPDGGTAPLEQDKYYIQEEWNGWDDTLCFSLPADHPQRPYMMERLTLTDKESGQRYLITAIDEGKNQTDFVAALDLHLLQVVMHLDYTNGSATAYETISGILPPAWSILDKSGLTMRRTISLEGATKLDIIKQCVETYPGLAIRIDNARLQVILYCPDNEQTSGAYFTDELNLTARPQFKGKAKDFYTRLYAVGKDGMTFASINNGKNYVDCDDYDPYRVISRYWKDERYTDPESLLAAAKVAVNKASVPERSYECSVNDLAKVDPEKYAYLGISMYQAVTLIDRKQNKRLRHQVARYRRWPHHPEKNVVTLSTVPGTVSGRVSQVYAAVNDTAGLTPFQQRQQALVDSATAWLTGADGYVVAVKNEDGSWKELLFMDTNDQATAKNVLRINTNGIGFSTAGVNGPYKNAWTIDGNLLADFITSGTLNAAQITVLNLVASAVKLDGDFSTRNGSLWAKLWAGVFNMGRTVDGKDLEWLGLSSTGSDDENGAGIINVWKWLNGVGSIATQIWGGGISTQEITAETSMTTKEMTISGRASINGGATITGGNTRVDISEVRTADGYSQILSYSNGQRQIHVDQLSMHGGGLYTVGTAKIDGYTVLTLSS